MNNGKTRTFREGSKLAKLEALLIPDVFPQDITEEQLKSIGIVGGNGQGTLRKDGSLAKKYDYDLLRSEGRGNTVTGICFRGYSTAHEFRSNIPPEVRDAYRNKSCVFLGLNAGGMEIDHKDGWKCSGTKVEDFQPACKSANVSKRFYCNNVCKPNGNRFDARGMGFRVGWTRGGSIRNQQIECRGCYLYDPVAFRQELRIKS